MKCHWMEFNCTNFQMLYQQLSRVMSEERDFVPQIDGLRLVAINGALAGLNDPSCSATSRRNFGPDLKRGKAGSTNN